MLQLQKANESNSTVTKHHTPYSLVFSQSRPLTCAQKALLKISWVLLDTQRHHDCLRQQRQTVLKLKKQENGDSGVNRQNSSTSRNSEQGKEVRN
jgi:hypothetical protein